MSLRRIPAPLHLPVRIAYANAWEALISTHTSQALQFVCEFASRATTLRALDLYFEVVAVPEAMQEVVRTQCLTSLELESLPPLTVLPVLRGRQRLRLDLVLEHHRYRRRYLEKTLQLARMVGARAAEAVIATHVENAMGFCVLLRGVLPVEQATNHYLREFSLSSSAAQMVWQRVQARVVGDELTAQYQDPPPPVYEPLLIAAQTFPVPGPELVDELELEPQRQIDVRRGEGAEWRGVAGAEVPHFETDDGREAPPREVTLDDEVPEARGGDEVVVLGVVDADTSADLPTIARSDVELGPTAGRPNRHAVPRHALPDPSASEAG